MSIPAFRLVRLAAAMEAGAIAARLRLAGETPCGKGIPEDHGAYQWADACGFEDAAPRSAFTSSFLDELHRANR
jgi:hypothetical protein